MNKPHNKSMLLSEPPDGSSLPHTHRSFSGYPHDDTSSKPSQQYLVCSDNLPAENNSPHLFFTHQPLSSQRELIHSNNKSPVLARTEALHNYPPVTDAFEEDTSFIKPKISVFPIKRVRTPILELPPPDKIDSKFDEIGMLCEKTPLEILEESKNMITCYSLRYLLTSIRYHVQSTCLKIAEHPLFEATILLIILANCVILALDDPTVTTQDQWQIRADYVFQALYTAEIAIKVLGMGFMLGEEAYLKDPWNILDFTIVVFGYLSMFNLGGGVDLKALRTFRVLRPLRTVSSVEGLRVLISALVTSLPPLMDTLIILMFFFMIFAIAGLQLWHGILRKRCFNIETGELDSDRICGYESCSAGWTCIEGFGNPNYGATHFDDIFTALLTVFQCVTMEGWTDTQLLTIRAFGPYAVLFYVPLILSGSFFLVNFTLAVIKSKVAGVYEENRKQKQLTRHGRKRRRIVPSPDELQHEVENKISLAQLLGLQQTGSEDYKRQIIPFSLQLHTNANTGKDKIENIYLKKLGFPDIEKELSEAPVEGKIVRNEAKVNIPPIHEDVIKEEDENMIDVSSIDDADNSVHFPTTPMRRNINLKMAPLAPLGNKKIIKLGETSTKQIEIESRQKKLALSGMIGIRKVLPVGVKAAFCGLEGLDEFSETFFAQQDTFAACAASQDTPKKSSRRLGIIQYQGSDASSSFLDVEVSQFQSISKEATPVNSSHTRDFVPFIITPQEILPSEFPQPFQSVLERRGNNILKKQTTTSTSISSSNAINDVGNKPSPMKNKLLPPKINILSKEEVAEKEEEESVKQVEEVPKNEGNERPPEKFILKEGAILITSAADVQPRKTKVATTKKNVADLTQEIFPPYKIKVMYEPTRLPEEEDTEALDEVINDTLHRTSRRKRLNSLSIAGSSFSISRRTPSVVSTRTRGKKKGKGRKKGRKRSEIGSRTGSRGTSQRQSQAKNTKTDQPSVNSGGQETSRNNESRSVGDSILTTARKVENGLAEDIPAADGNFEQPPIFKEKPNKKKFTWSGQEVLISADPYYALYATSYMNEARIWKQGWEGTLKKIRKITKTFAVSSILENVMNLFVMINTITLAMDRYGQPQSESYVLNVLNLVFTGIFIAELVVKVFGLGVVGYLSDPFNYLDGSVVIFSLVEIVFLNGQGALAAFRTLRIFRAVRMIRTFRVLRVARLLRSLRSMQTIIEVIGKTIGSFAYIGLLMLIVVFIYSLFGMQLFGGRFDFPEGTPRQNFDSFNNAFLTMFQVLTMENWHSVLYDCMRAQNPILSAIYLVTWIFIGNYILLNLFLAIMLDAFTEVDEEMGDDSEDPEEEDERIDVSKSGTVTLTGTLRGGTLRGPGSVAGSIRSKSQFAQAVAKQKTILDSDSDRNELTKAAKDEDLSDYKKLESTYSLFLFHKESTFRILLWKTCTSTLFEGIILALICLGSIKLAVDTYFLHEPNNLHTRISTIVDLFLTIAFALEALIKVIAYGFLLEPTTYLRDSWNQLDFFIVVASIVDTSLSQVDIPMIKILRLLRTFRPLRFVTHNVNMRIIVTALFKSLGAIFNTLIVVVVIWLMFSIVGVNFFAGKFQYCSVDPYQNSHKEECIMNKGEWRTYDTNFDNSINGLIFLFILTTQENWPELVYQAIDCTDVEEGPSVGSQWYYAYYFVVFLLIGSMFLLNLFVGVMFLNFTKVQKHETTSFGDIMVTESQLNWIEVQKMIIRAEPEYNARTVPPQYNWRKPFHNIVTSTVFEVSIAVAILLNMVQMALFYEDATKEYVFFLDVINYIFTGVFTVELVLKLIAFSWNFWYEAWNIFDFVVVFCSYIEIVFSLIGAASLRMLRIGPQLVRVLRVLRVSRLLRLIKKYQRLQDIMEIVQLCLPSMMNVFSLLTLVLFIYAVLGCYLFSDITTGDGINDFYNFNNFGLALILCLKLATGEDWNKFMFDYARTDTDCAIGLGCGNAVAFVYFLSFKLVITFIMLNLFILIVLQLFDKFFISKDNLLSKFKEDFAVFQDAWKGLAPTHSGFMINQGKLIRFFSSLQPPMGMEGMGLNEITKEIIDLGIRSNEEKDIFFNELMYCTMRRQYLKLFKMNGFIKNKERETRRKIQTMAERAAKRGHYKTARKTFIQTANPFVSLMILRITLKLWRKYNKQHKERVEEYESRGILNYESSREEDMFPPVQGSLSPRRSRNRDSRRRVSSGYEQSFRTPFSPRANQSRPSRLKPSPNK